MISLKLTKNFHNGDMWGRRLIYHLSQSKDCKMEILPLPPINVFRGHKNFTPLIYNDIVFIIDDWDHATPTMSLIDNPDALHQFYKDNTTVILKIQYSPNQAGLYQKVYDQHGILVLPFTMFANRTFKLSAFEWKSSDEHIYTSIFTGKPWNCRRSWLNFAEEHKEEINCYLNFDYTAGDASRNPPNGDNPRFTNFYELLQKTKWGVILKGKGDGGKNRREVEFASLGMPLALNYTPHYPFEFVPDKDYLLLREPSDLLKLKDIDPEPFAARSKEIYHQYFSPENGILNSFNMAYEVAKQTYINSNPIDYVSILPDKDILKISAKNDYYFGVLKSGEKLHIQYKNGAWKSWGGSGRGMVNPDNTNNRGGDKAKLAIFHTDKYSKKILGIVPENTINNPYIFTADQDYDISFGMCDKSRRPRGEVSYIIRLL